MKESGSTLKLKELLIESLGLEGMTPVMIDDDEPLFESGLGLDSVDALEIIVALEQNYGIRIRGHEVPREAFESVSGLQRLVDELVSDHSTA